MKEKLNLNYSALQMVSWVSFCAAITFAAVFLQGRGYSNAQLGVVMCCGSIAGFVLAQVSAMLVDRFEKLTSLHMLYILLAMQACFVLLLRLLPEKSLAISVIYALYMSSLYASAPMVTQLSVEMEYGGRKINYGVSRSMGSIAYAIASALFGVMVKEKGSEAMLPAALIIIGVQLLVLISFSLRRRLWEVKGTVVDKRRGSPLPVFFKNNKRFFVLLLGLVFIFFTQALSSNYMINIVRHCGGDTDTMGYLGAYIAIIEVPIMLSYAKLNRKFKCSSLLRLSILFFLVKIVGVTLAKSTFGLFAAFATQMLSYALYTPAIVHYVNLHIAYKDSAKGQSLAFSVTTLGSIFANLLGGIMYDNIGVTPTLIVGIAVTMVGVLICQFGIEKRKRVTA